MEALISVAQLMITPLLSSLCKVIIGCKFNKTVVMSLFSWPNEYIHNMVPTARDIKIVKKLKDVEVMEKESASFTCEISHDDVEYQWFRGNTKIKASENIKMRQEGKACFFFNHCDSQLSFFRKFLYPSPGRTYILLFKSVTPEDMGEIKFTAEKVTSAAKLKVKGKQICIVITFSKHNILDRE